MNTQERDALLLLIQKELLENTAKTDQLLKAFPGGDTDGHRRYHEAVIEWRELRNKMVRESLIKVFQSGALIGTGWLALALWQAFKTTVKQ